MTTAADHSCAAERDDLNPVLIEPDSPHEYDANVLSRLGFTLLEDFGA